MSWLSTFWNHNRDFLGNALKNVAPAAFLIPGVGAPMAALLGGAGSALGRGIQRGGNLGNILKQGAQGAGLAYTGGQLTGKEGYHALTKLFTGGGKAAAGEAATAGGGQTTALALPGTSGPGAALGTGSGGVGVTPVARSASAALGGTPTATSASQFPVAFTPSSATVAPSTAAITGPSVAEIPTKGLSHLARAGAFAKEYPQLAAMGLQGLGTLSTLPATYAANKREQTLFDEQMAERQRRREALAPLYKMLMGQMEQANAYQPLPPNPYHKFS